MSTKCFVDVFISRDRRRIVHWEVADIKQTLESCSSCAKHSSNHASQKHVIFDRATNFNSEVVDIVRTRGPESNEPASEAHGRTVLTNAELAVTTGTCSITSSS